MERNIHVTHRQDGSWAVIGEKKERATGLFATQADAIERGQEIAERIKGELFIHDRKNRIRDRDSFGSDPPERRDTKH